MSNKVMSGTMEELFQDRKYCIEQIQEARKVMTDKNLFTRESADKLQDTLGFMYVYGPEELMVTIIALISEIETRVNYLFPVTGD